MIHFSVHGWHRKLARVLTCTCALILPTPEPPPQPSEPRTQVSVRPAKPEATPGNCLDYAIRTLKLNPDPIQSRILASKSRQIILNCARQWGKSTVAAAIGAYTLATAKPGSQVLIVAPCKRQSGELLRRVESLLQLAGHKTKGDGINDLSIELANGSRGIALPGTEATSRCFSDVALLIVDEAARVQDDTYKSVRAFVMASQGRILILSTPYGLRGFFHDEWQKNSPDFERFTVRGDQCPRFTEEMLETERRSLGDLWFRQEYLCEFITTHEQIFMPDKVHSVLTDKFEPYTPRQIFGPLWHITPWNNK